MQNVTIFAAQRPIVRQTIEKDGVYHVKKIFIEKKYGESSWIFNTAYSFFKSHAGRIVPCPKEAESAIWLYCNPQMAVGGDDAELLTFSIPEDKLVFFDSRLWHRILNLKYIGKDEQDEKAFEAELRAMGIDGTKVFSSNFYPQQRQMILDSWLRLFDSANCDPHYRQAAAWELRKEWLI